jgi:hypothetical protein
VLLFQISCSTICRRIEFDELTLDLYYKEGKEKSVVYEDAQDGYDYKKGRYSFLTFRVTGKEKSLISNCIKKVNMILIILSIR